MIYKTVSATSVQILDKDVNELIQQGYEPHGIVFTNDNMLHQSMILDPQEDEEEDRGGITPSVIANLALLQGLFPNRMRFGHRRRRF